MKIVAIFDFDEFPKTCKECPKHEGEGYFYCPLIHGSHGSLAWYFNGDRERNPYCPLKPIPNKRPVSYHDDLFGDVEKNFRNIGWNDCIEEILNGR